MECLLGEVEVEDDDDEDDVVVGGVGLFELGCEQRGREVDIKTHNL